MLVKSKNDFNDYVKTWDEGAVKDAPFITLGVEAVFQDFYGNLLDAPPPFPVKDDDIILDLGCGWGRVLKPVMDRTGYAIGLDISHNMLNNAREHLENNGHEPVLLRGDGTSLPFKNDSIDMIYSLLVLQHISKENGKSVFEEVRRVLKPGGTAYIRVPGRFAPENILFSFLQFISINFLGVNDPIRMRFYRVGEAKKICNVLFSECEITAHEFRPPWNFHTKWTWQYLIVPRRFHKTLRKISDWFEKLANNHLSFLKHFGVVLMVRVRK